MLIFLDIDGVLNNIINYQWQTETQPLILTKLMHLLNNLVSRTHARIVVSSSWRYQILQGACTDKGFEYLLKSHGFIGAVVGHTCSDEERTSRGQQIKKWIEDNAFTGGRYVILDDCDDDLMLYHPDNTVLTDGSIGLTEKNIEDAVNILWETRC